MALIRKVVPQPAPLDRDDAFRKAQEALLSVGITATCDMDTMPDDWNVWRRAGDARALRVRIVSYGHGVETALSIAGTGPTPWLYDNHLRMVGVKLFADGALGSRGAWLKQPYADMPSTRGTSLLDDTRLKNLMSRAAMDNFQVAVHAIGDAANAQVLDAIDELSDTYKGDRRWRIEHAQIVSPADLPRFAQHGIVASMQPTHADQRLADGGGAARARSAEGRLCVEHDARRACRRWRSDRIIRSRARIPSPVSPLRSVARMRMANPPAAGIQASGSRCRRRWLPSPRGLPMRRRRRTGWDRSSPASSRISCWSIAIR